MKFSLWMLALAGLCAATAAHDPPPPAETEIHYRSRGKGRLKMSDGARHTMAPSPYSIAGFRSHTAQMASSSAARRQRRAQERRPQVAERPRPEDGPRPCHRRQAHQVAHPRPHDHGGRKHLCAEEEGAQRVLRRTSCPVPSLRDSTVALLRVSRRNSRFFFSVTLSAARLTRHLFDNFSESG